MFRKMLYLNNQKKAKLITYFKDFQYFKIGTFEILQMLLLKARIFITMLVRNDNN